MFTRSKVIRYSNIIDFDEASEAWKANKKYVGNGSYKYICCQITKSGNCCKRESVIQTDYCKMHTKKVPTKARRILGIGHNKIVGDCHSLS